MTNQKVETPPSVISSDDLTWNESTRGDFHHVLYKSLSSNSAGKEIGCSLFELPPHKQSFPFHYHLANEEAIFVLEGTGQLRLGDQRLSVKSGDYIALPNHPNAGRQMINNSDAPLRYLCISTMNAPDVAVYPDSKKVAVFGGMAPGGNESDCTYFALLKETNSADYWDDETHDALSSSEGSNMEKS